MVRESEGEPPLPAARNPIPLLRVLPVVGIPGFYLSNPGDCLGLRPATQTERTPQTSAESAPTNASEWRSYRQGIYHGDFRETHIAPDRRTSKVTEIMPGVTYNCSLHAGLRRPPASPAFGRYFLSHTHTRLFAERQTDYETERKERRRGARTAAAATAQRSVSVVPAPLWRGSTRCGRCGA